MTEVMTEVVKRHCTATKRDGTPCRAWAVRGSDPPRCAAHGGRRAAQPKPEDIPDTIDLVIHDLASKQRKLSDYIEVYTEADPKNLSVRDLARLFQIHGQNASRIGRLLRDQRALSGEATDGIAGAIAQALDELATELGTDL
jgi:hypothetical protein